MIGITVFGSGSSGNCYCLDNGTSQLLIETGIPYKKVAPKMGFDFTRVTGVLISHEHGDHSKYLNQFLQHTNSNIYMTSGTAGVLNIDDSYNYRIKAVKPLVDTVIGDWKVTPFSVEHDAAEPVGFLIESGGDKLIYVTDTYYVKYKFKGITRMMVEMNYSAEIAAKNTTDGVLNRSLEKRILTSHFEMDNSLSFIKANMSLTLRDVLLIHISKTNGDPELFQHKVQELTGVPVYIAK
ncbi:MBL fold metallo-hydrolase [Lapidilactobacillus mulanensis]|uniref:MBL fold metallo-hydrolase n=1 Tax=Lapidilactobacillus mulanensis TaxID=2485999 RepID=A0ABW4DU55_9LACO|nr:MBL fold metallo-hydrolase [Lapidilactobacillus mulanensis]